MRNKIPDHNPLLLKQKVKEILDNAVYKYLNDSYRIKNIPAYKKTGKIHEFYYPETGSCVRYTVRKDHILISSIKSYRSGDAHYLMEAVYKKHPKRIFKTDVIISPERKRALRFWKAEGFKIVNKVGQHGIQFYEMERK